MKIKLDFKFGGLGLTLSIVFAALKLAGVIDWSWFVVALPVLIGFVGSILLFIGMLIFTFSMISKHK